MVKFSTSEKIFGKWDISEINIDDPAIRMYVSLTPKYALHSHGRHAKQKFLKVNVPIVERLINKMMRKEHNTGKKHQAYNIVKEAFEIIHKRTKKNPVEVLIKAIENAGPREEIVRLKYGGIAVPKAVDTSTIRRIDQALMNIAKGAREASFKSRRSIEEALASEIIAAANNDAKCYSISKKEEKERIAKAAR